MPERYFNDGSVPRLILDINQRKQTFPVGSSALAQKTKPMPKIDVQIQLPVRSIDDVFKGLPIRYEQEIPLRSMIEDLLKVPHSMSVRNTLLRALQDAWPNDPILRGELMRRVLALHTDKMRGPDNVRALRLVRRPGLKKAKDKIPGGLADNIPESAFNKKDLEEGIQVELEHTSSRTIASEIARDHLKEDKNYYKKLKKIEKSDALHKANEPWKKTGNVQIGGGNRPSGAGWMPIPGSKHGGYHRRKGGKWEYWYPDSATYQKHHSGEKTAFEKKVEAKKKPKEEPKKEEPKLVVKTERKFEDYGEKIEGARKHISSFTSLEEIKNEPAKAKKYITKNNVFGKWTKEIADKDKENGVSPAASWAKKELLNLISNKPVADTAEYQLLYLEQSKLLQEALGRMKTADDVKDFIQETVDALNGQKLGKIIDTDNPVYNWPWDDKDSMYQAYELLDAARKEPEKPTVHDYLKAIDALKNSPSYRNDIREISKIYGVRVMPNGEKRIVNVIPGGSLQEKKELSVFGKRFALIFNQSLSKRRFGVYLRSSYGQSKEHQEFIKNLDDIKNWDWSEEEKKTTTTPREKPQVKEISRESKQWIWTKKIFPILREGGKELTYPKDSEEFAKSFNLRGVQYGNWANDAEREIHIKGCYSALHDLAEVLGIDVNKLAINNRLAMAFGARGTGGKRAPVAHYEPVERVINLTKIKGAGSLAHEWGHFMDHAIMMQTGDKGTLFSKIAHNKYRSAKVDEKIKNAFNDVMNSIKFFSVYSREEKTKVAKEISDKIGPMLVEISTLKQSLKYETKREYDADGSLKAIVRQLTPESEKMVNEKLNPLIEQYNTLSRKRRNIMSDRSEFFNDAEMLGGGYYGSSVEIFARCFESYIEDKLAEKGIKNTYLVAGTRGDVEPGIYIKPGSEHRKEVNKAFDNFIKVMRSNDQFSKSMGL